jgi:DNA-directed RNA polymerase specialized sigma subunit
MHQHPLNDLYSQYSGGLIGRGEFEGRIYEYLVNNQDKTSLSHWKHDEYEDFVSCFYTRLRKAIDSYRETGSSFETYTGTVMRLAAREHRIKAVTNSVTEYSAWSVQIPDLYACEETPSYLHEKHEDAIPQITVPGGRKNPKQLLALILKCYYHVSDDFLDRAACHIGIDRKKLKGMIDKLRIMRQKKDDEIFRMKERIYCQYYRCIVYEKRLLFIPENTSAYIKLKLRLEKARRRLEKMRWRITKIRTDATNREVAEVIGISKGAVDASLYSLKTKWDMLADKAMLN